MKSGTTSVGRAQHSEPTFTLYGRVAADPIGRIGRPYPSLHVSLVIDDAYTGITVIDGQPTMVEAGVGNALRIRTNVYANALPAKPVMKTTLNPPEQMSRQEFAQALLRALYLLLFIAAMAVVGYYALYAAFIVNVMIFGL